MVLWRTSLTVLHHYHETESNRLNEERSDRVKSSCSRVEKILYVPVTHKVSLISRTFCSFQKHSEMRFCIEFQRYAYVLFAIAHGFNGFEAFRGEFR